MRLDPAVIRMQIERLLGEYDLTQEDIPLALESETDTIEFLRAKERERQEKLAMAVALDIVISDMSERLYRFKRTDFVIRQLMMQILQAANLRKLELPEATLSIRTGSPKVIVTDEAALPETFIRIKREPDKASIKVALQDGIPVPGATLSNAEENLTIRTK